MATKSRSEDLQNFERLLLFFLVLKEAPQTKDEQIMRFVQISGMSDTRAQSALEVCRLKGFVGDVPEPESTA